jgi:N-terminal acetyltransferase B complex non-catalytic subunit
LSNSLHYSLTSVEALLLEMVYFSGSRAQNLASYKNMSINPAEDRIKWAELSDNRDLSVIIRWDPTFEAPPANGDSAGDGQVDVYKRMEADSFVQDTELLRVRSILLRLIAGSVDLLATPNEADELVSEAYKQKRKIVADLLDNWSALFKRLRSGDDDTLRPTSREYLVNLLQSRLHVMLRLPYEAVFTKLFTFIGKLCDGDPKAKAMGETLSDDLAELNRMFAERIEEHNKEKDLLWARKFVQETLVAIIEVSLDVVFKVKVITFPFSSRSSPSAPSSYRFAASN